MPRAAASATTLLPIAAGVIAAAAVGLTWLPLMRETRSQDERVRGRLLQTTAELGAASLPEAPSEHFAVVNQGANAAGALIRDWTDGRYLPALRRIADQPGIREAAVLGASGRLLASTGDTAPGSDGGAPAATAGRACPVNELGAAATLFRFEDSEGNERLGACARGSLPGAPPLVLVVAGDDQNPVARMRESGIVLLVGVGTMAGMAVVLGVRWLLVPLHEAAAAAERIANGARKVRMTPRGPPEIRRVAEAINALASAADTRQDEVEGRLRVVTELSHMVAHEVRNPLQSLSLLCTLARTEHDAATRDKILASIENEIHVLEAVVQRFLRDSGPLRISRVPTDLADLVRTATSLVEPQARARKVMLMVQAPDELTLEVDGSLLRRTLENLLLNAVQSAAISPPGQVTASLVRRGANCLLVVDDDGPGVPAAERDRIFQPYYSTKAGGTGLGLALVRQVVEAHGGYIRVDDSPLGGARFVASFPATVPAGGEV